jgi:hypothetical protein
VPVIEDVDTCANNELDEKRHTTTSKDALSVLKFMNFPR